MHSLFGIPTVTMMFALLVALGAALGAIAVLAVRNPVLVKLGTRNLARRRGRTALIVVGLMLGTAIIAAALTTGDTMSHTIRQTAVASLGETDEVVSARHAGDSTLVDLGGGSGVGYFDESVATRIERATASSSLVDGVTGAIVSQVAAQAPRSGQNEPNVTLFGGDPDRMHGFAPITDVRGERLSLGSLQPGEVYLNRKAAAALHARAGDSISVFAGGEPVTMRVRDVVTFDGSFTADAAMLVPLAEAQRLVGRPGKIQQVLVSNRGGSLSGAARTAEVLPMLRAAVAGSGLEVTPAKRDAVRTADEIGSGFMAFFSTFGSFSIAAGIMLIFLIFVMLAAERRGELGIARAIGTRRGHLVEMFVFEGAAYDLIAAVVGALLGAAVAYVMVLAMAKAFGSDESSSALDVSYAVSPRSLIIAFATGVLMTLAVVAFSAWKVSRMTIAAAIRNLPEPAQRGGRGRLVLGVGGVALGAILLVAAGSAATPIMLGTSLILVSLVPILRRIGVPERLAFTSCGLVLVTVLMLPWSAWEAVFGQMSMNFTTWIVSGLMIVVGTVWVIVYNADVALGLAQRTLGRLPALAPVVRLSLAYPLASRLRTGMTLAMFTLVVFTIVTGSTTSGSFMHAAEDLNEFGGGFQVRSETSANAPITGMPDRVRATPELATDVRAVAEQSVLAVSVRQSASPTSADYLVRGLDRTFLDRTTFGLGAIASGYSTSAQVWRALRDHPGLAVVDTSIVPRRDDFGFQAAPPDLQLRGAYVDESGFTPIPLMVTDPQTGRRVRLTVIGVLKDTAPLEMAGISTSQRTLAAAFPGRVAPTIEYYRLAPGADPDQVAAGLERSFLKNGLDAQSIRDVVHDAAAASLTFNRLILAFMGLGLIVGVAALGVVSARSVVERRQHIGVLRAVGFRRGTVQASFLLESAIISVTAILVGTALGLILANNIITDQRQTASWSNVTLIVPWLNLAVVFTTVTVVSLLATLAPALRASRIEPAAALRYE